MNKTKRFGPAGFTLLEIMLVVVIIGMLVGVASWKLTGKIGQAKDVTTRQQMDAYKMAIGSYELDNGFLPTTEQGLQALVSQPSSPPVPNNWKGPYLDPPVIKPDAWGHPFIYKCPGVKLPSSYDLYSPGPDGIEGNEDDIGNWQ